MQRSEQTTRRDFLGHLTWGTAALTGSVTTFCHPQQRLEASTKPPRKSAILLWLGGGPSTIDLWDLKPGAATSGPFRPIGTTGEFTICEHLPQLASQMHHLSVVRSMSTKEADHTRAQYYLRTGHVPDQSIQHPSYGAVVSKEISASRTNLEIPPFVSIGGGSIGAGFLGIAYAPFIVNSNGNIDNLPTTPPDGRFRQRIKILQSIENNFTAKHPQSAAEDHAQVLQKTLALMTTEQRRAFRIDEEPESVRGRYGDTEFGRGCVMARRLVEAGVPFVEVNYSGWDNHANIFTTLQDERLPTLDQAMSALVDDLHQRGRLQDTVVLCMGEFGRTPRINGNGGRDHYARAWSAVVGGGGLRGGIAIGETSADGMRVITEPYSSEDLMATVCQTLGISLQTQYTSRNGRPMKIANGGRVIPGLIL
ncbi:MAG: DUF1501 domain-containing protein [Planctomycetota bacterium]|nr:DUF1501 domain-containing protein [Planctomycetota bacterium]MDA1179928.1 DUF1501 domain-containing protein [Planctomycetota bacterium]